MSGIRHLQISHGLPDPCVSSMPILQQVLRGIRSSQAKRGMARRTRLPITPPLLIKLRSIWSMEASKQDNIMLWAASTLCFFGFFRAGEITVPSDQLYDPNSHLGYPDIAVDNLSRPSVLRVHLKVSKTDPFRRGIDVFVGRTFNKLCPVEAMMAYLAVRGDGACPLFRFEDSRLLTRQRFVSQVREALRKAGIESRDYASHSFRSGAATTAARCGINEATIKLLGRWESCAYLLYIKTLRDVLAEMSKSMSELA